MRTIIFILAICLTLGIKAQTAVDTTQHIYYIWEGIPDGFTFPKGISFPTNTPDTAIVEIAFIMGEYGDRDSVRHPHIHTFNMPTSIPIPLITDSVINRCLSWLQKHYYINGLNATIK